jgi:hypothetical protein
MSFASTYALGHVAKRYYAGGRSFSAPMLRAGFRRPCSAKRKGLHSRYLPEMQARARTLDTARIVDLVRQRLSRSRASGHAGTCGRSGPDGALLVGRPTP